MRSFGVVPPDDWLRVELTLARVPPSMNANKIRSHWRGFHTEKKSWEAEIQLALLEHNPPRGNQRAIASAIMRFPKRAKRDTGSFKGVVEKALGDALAYRLDPEHRRYIPDDDAERFLFTGVEFEKDPGPARTRIIIFFQPPEED